jgi:GT2 family glycosyltransferase
LKYVFITVNYNNADETIKYIKSIGSLVFKQEAIFKVIIIDNDSDKTDYNKLENYCNNYFNSKIEINLIRNLNNIGYFAGLNVGLDAVSEVKEKTCIIGNNDVVFEVDFLSQYANLEIPTDAIVVCPDIINKDGIHENPQLKYQATTIMKLSFKVYFTSYWLSIIVFNASKFAKKIGLRRPNKSYISDQFIYQGSGACYVLPVQFFDFYKRLDDGVFLWGEERLLANQVKLVGRKTWYTPLLKIHHNESRSTSRIRSIERWRINKESYKIYRHYM